MAKNTQATDSVEVTEDELVGPEPGTPQIVPSTIDTNSAPKAAEPTEKPEPEVPTPPVAEPSKPHVSRPWDVRRMYTQK